MLKLTVNSQEKFSGKNQWECKRFLATRLLKKYSIKMANNRMKKKEHLTTLLKETGSTEQTAHLVL